MEIASLSKRLWAYIINLIFYLAISFAGSLPFLISLKIEVFLYIIISLGISFLLSFIFDIILLIIFKGYTLGSAIMGIKYVGGDAKRLKKKQIVILSLGESIPIIVIFDLIYFLKTHTERGIIDRLSDSFAIDTRR